MAELPGAISANDPAFGKWVNTNWTLRCGSLGWVIPTTPTTLAEVKRWYGDYLRQCNAHRFEDLGRFVASGVEVNGERVGLSGYIAGLRAVVDAFSDYQWQLHHVLVGS